MAATPYAIEVVTVPATSLAIIKEVAWAQNIGAKIGATIPAVHTGLRQLGVLDVGSDVVVYHPDQGRWDEPPGIHVEIGTLLKGRLAVEAPPLLRSETPACRAAHARHVGPYRELPEAHMAIHRWCREHGQAMAGRNWEVYGPHHEPDPSKLVTDVYYELR